MLPPDSLTSPEALFASIEESISVCHSFSDGVIEVNIRKISPEELELSVFAFRGCFRCPYGDIQNYLKQLPYSQQNHLSIYRDRFRVGLIKILPSGFGSLKLDFTKSKKGKTPPMFGLMMTELLNNE
jgi:hypothetical protein